MASTALTANREELQIERALLTQQGRQDKLRPTLSESDLRTVVATNEESDPFRIGDLGNFTIVQELGITGVDGVRLVIRSRYGRLSTVMVITVMFAMPQVNMQTGIVSVRLSN